MAPLVSAVIVTWNSASTIEGLLDSLSAAPETIEAIVIDNHSADNTVALAKAHPSRPIVIANRTNRGLAAANNQGMLAASGEFYLICNPDLTVNLTTVTALLACAERHPKAAFIVTNLRHPDGELQTTVGDLPRLGEALIGRRQARKQGRLQGQWWDGWAHDEERQFGHGNEACYLVRAKAVAEIGPQDERYILDWEGLDWSARAAENGWEVWFCPEAEAIHIGGVSIEQAPKLRWIMSTHKGMYLYFSGRSPRAMRPLLAVLIGARGAAKAAMILRRPDTYRRAYSKD